MTKKHFIAAAENIKLDLKSGMITLDTARYAAELFANIAKQSNANFDRDRFFAACGVK